MAYRMSTALDVTQLLQAWSRGEADALERLVPLVYRDLHQMATFYFQRESETHTLQPTALVNEVYLRMSMSGEENLAWDNRRQFFGFAAKLMRHVLVDHARTRTALKRGNGAIHLSLEDVHGVTIKSDVDVVALNEVLEQLSKIDPRQAEVVQLRFFIGLTVEEIAELLEVSCSTVKREWRAAKFWLHRKLAVRDE